MRITEERHQRAQARSLASQTEVSGENRDFLLLLLSMTGLIIALIIAAMGPTPR